jgi:hypothetical protein
MFVMRNPSKNTIKKLRSITDHIKKKRGVVALGRDTDPFDRNAAETTSLIYIVAHNIYRISKGKTCLGVMVKHK